MCQRTCMKDAGCTLAQLKQVIESFVAARDWQQFHSAKNLSMALSVEAAELMEHFMWLKDSDIPATFDKLREPILEEVADVAILLLALCNRYNIDLTQAVVDKLAKNDAKYPVEKSRGRATKYTEL